MWILNRLLQIWLWTLIQSVIQTMMKTDFGLLKMEPFEWRFLITLTGQMAVIRLMKMGISILVSELVLLQHSLTICSVTMLVRMVRNLSWFSRLLLLRRVMLPSWLVRAEIYRWMFMRLMFVVLLILFISHIPKRILLSSSLISVKILRFQWFFLTKMEHLEDPWFILLTIPLHRMSLFLL